MFTHVHLCTDSFLFCLWKEAEPALSGRCAGIRVATGNKRVPFRSNMTPHDSPNISRRQTFKISLFASHYLVFTKPDVRHANFAVNSSLSESKHLVRFTFYRIVSKCWVRFVKVGLGAAGARSKKVSRLEKKSGEFIARAGRESKRAQTATPWHTYDQFLVPERRRTSPGF